MSFSTSAQKSAGFAFHALLLMLEILHRSFIFSFVRAFLQPQIGTLRLHRTHVFFLVSRNQFNVQWTSIQAKNRTIRIFFEKHFLFSGSLFLAYSVFFALPVSFSVCILIRITAQQMHSNQFLASKMETDVKNHLRSFQATYNLHLEMANFCWLFAFASKSVLMPFTPLPLCFSVDFSLSRSLHLFIEALCFSSGITRSIVSRTAHTHTQTHRIKSVKHK